MNVADVLAFMFQSSPEGQGGSQSRSLMLYKRTRFDQSTSYTAVDMETSYFNGQHNCRGLSIYGLVIIRNLIHEMSL